MKSEGWAIMLAIIGCHQQNNVNVVIVDINLVLASEVKDGQGGLGAMKFDNHTSSLH